MITCDLDVLPKIHITKISNPIEMLIYTYTYNLSFSYPTKKIFNLLYNAVLLYSGTSLCHIVFTKHIEVGKISCLQWHVSSIEPNMQLRDILNHFKQTAEAAASTSGFVHLILGQNAYMCFTTLGALPKHFFGFDVLSRSGKPQLSNLTDEYPYAQQITTKGRPSLRRPNKFLRIRRRHRRLVRHHRTGSREKRPSFIAMNVIKKTLNLCISLSKMTLQTIIVFLM